MAVPKLPRGVSTLVESKVDELFDRAKVRFLGPQSVARRLHIGYDRTLSLPGLFESASAVSGGIPDREVLDSLIRTASNYMDASKHRAKARVINALQAFIRNAENAGDGYDIPTVLGGELADLWGDVTHDVRRIFDTESQQTRGIGVMDGIARVNASMGIEDPVIFFVVVRDDRLCDECKRLHLLPDGITPRVYYQSEVAHGYHTKGSDTVCVGGLHPHCRCSPTTLMPGYGFDSAGRVTWRGEGHDEITAQRS